MALVRTHDWINVPPVLRPRIPNLLGTKPGQIHRSHLPLLTSDMRDLLIPEKKTECDIPYFLLRPYQAKAAEFAASREGCILGMFLGAGKTRTALAASYSPNKLGVIVAPLVTFGVWRREIANVYGPDYPVTVVRGRKLTEGADFQKPGIYLLNPEILKARWSEWLVVRPEFLILDEAHLYITPTTQRHEGAATLAGCCKHRIALTGTPVLRHVTDYYGILRCICGTAFGGKYDFNMSLGAKHGKFGVMLGTPSVEQMEVFDKRMQEILLYLRWQEVSTEIPPLARERLPITLTPAEKREYNFLLSDVRKVLGKRVSYGDVAKASAMIQIGALWRFVGRVKVKHVVDLACSSSEQIVIWTWHRDIAKDISERISKRDGSEVGVITGDTSHKQRDILLDNFRDNSLRIIVCTIAVAGVGIDLTSARISIFAEMCWTPSDLAQCEGRVWRTGQQRNCMTYWPVVEGTIEDHMLDVLLRKEYYAKSGVFGGLETKAPVADLESEMIELLDLAVGDLA